MEPAGRPPQGTRWLHFFTNAEKIIFEKKLVENLLVEKFNILLPLNSTLLLVTIYIFITFLFFNSLKMKKLFVMLAAVAAISFTSCKNEVANTDEAMTAESFQTELDSLVVAGDATAVEGLIEKSNKQIETLIAAGDTVAAKSLYQKIVEIVGTQKDKLDAIKPNLSSLIGGANIPDALKTIVKEAVDTAQALGEEAAGKAVNEVANKVAGTDEAKAVNEKAEEVKKTADKVNETAKDVKDAAEKTKDAVNALKNIGK